MSDRSPEPVVEALVEPVVIAGLQADEIDVVALVDLIRRDDCGGLVVFEGTTRTPNHGQPVEALEYEAWEDRTPDQLRSIVNEVALAHGLGGAVGVHRTGRVPPGGTAVVVAAAAPHRDAAFAGARDLIDRIKAEAWIWKKELGPHGEEWVEVCP